MNATTDSKNKVTNKNETGEILTKLRNIQTKYGILDWEAAALISISKSYLSYLYSGDKALTSDMKLLILMLFQVLEEADELPISRKLYESREKYRKRRKLILKKLRLKV